MTFPHNGPASDVLCAFGVHNPNFVTKTALATIWKVTRADGSQAALKCYADPGMPGEGPGFSWLKSINGTGAARFYARHKGSALVEWLAGPSLGDVARGGDVEAADHRLVATARLLHNAPAPPTPDMPLLTDWFRALREAQLPPDLAELSRHNMCRSLSMAETLLEAQTDLRPLHGDLHHDNIKSSARGDLAFDAKGIVGDRAYELANAFLNPVDTPQIVQDRTRINRLADIAAQAFDSHKATVLDWACAHAALSNAWHLRDGGDPDFTVLNLLWAVRDESE
ncbi:MAG: aminoglycoside phosphotransferase family protein [Pseudomonadota bacterium]